ncbi:hypothetical protein Hte_008832 [Hypoxylon texense]
MHGSLLFALEERMQAGTPDDITSLLKPQQNISDDDNSEGDPTTDRFKGLPAKKDAPDIHSVKTPDHVQRANVGRASPTPKTPSKLLFGKPITPKKHGAMEEPPSRRVRKSY